MYQGGASTSSKKKIAPSRSISRVPMVCMRARGSRRRVARTPSRPRWRVRRGRRDRAEPRLRRSAEHLEKTRMRGGRRLLVAYAGYPRAVERRQASALADRDVECGDVGVADERLRWPRWRRSRGMGWSAVTRSRPSCSGRRRPPGRRRARPGRRRAARAARDEVVPSVDPRGQLDAVALCLPPLDASEQVGAVFPRARGRGDADGPTVGKGAGEEGGRFQDVNLTSARNTVRRWVVRGSAGSRRRPPVCSPWWRLSPLTRRERRSRTSS